MRTIGTPSTQARKLNAIASGALPNGDPIVVNADGTVSAVGGGNLTAENYIGLASNGYPDTAGATIDVQGAINDRQSGLTAGQSILRPDGWYIGYNTSRPKCLCWHSHIGNKDDRERLDHENYT